MDANQNIDPNCPPISPEQGWWIYYMWIPALLTQQNPLRCYVWVERHGDRLEVRYRLTTGVDTQPPVLATYTPFMLSLN